MGFKSFDGIISSITNATPQKYNYWWQFQSGTAASTAGRWYASWAMIGRPAPGTYTAGASLSAVQHYASITGAIPMGNAVMPATKHLDYVTGMVPAATAVPGTLILVDRLLVYQGIVCTLSATQTFVTPAGLPRYTDGAGVQAWMEAQNALGNAGAKGVGRVNWSYTNQDGTAGQVSVGTTSHIYSVAQINSVANTATTTYFFNPFLPLSGADRGVRSVQSIDLNNGTLTSGVLSLVLGKPLATIPLPAINVYTERDLILQMANLERLYDGACLSWLWFAPGAVAASTIYNGELCAIWGEG